MKRSVLTRSCLSGVTPGFIFDASDSSHELRCTLCRPAHGVLDGLEHLAALLPRGQRVYDTRASSGSRAG
jgi:hypothetical protein